MLDLFIGMDINASMAGWNEMLESSHLLFQIAKGYLRLSGVVSLSIASRSQL